MKVSKMFSASLVKNQSKGGAWLCSVTVSTDGVQDDMHIAAWSNASAGKRWVKEKVQELTPRKSVKMEAGPAVDAKGKPVSFLGVLTYKA